MGEVPTINVAGPPEKSPAAKRREEEIKQRWTRNLSVPKVERAGVSPATLEIERQALDYCSARGHKLRDRGRQACRVCLQDALMGRLGERAGELPELPASVRDPVARHLYELLSDGGRWGLAELLDKVNKRRLAKGERPYTETSCSARIRDLRKELPTVAIHQDLAAEGGAEYWMTSA